MAVLNPPNALPGMAFVLTKYLQREGGKASREELAAVLSPMQERDAVLKPGSNLSGTLSVMENLGLVSWTNPVVLTKNFAGSIDAPVSRPTFDAAIRRTIVDTKRDGKNVWDDDGIDGGKDIARALTWFLGQPAYGPVLAFGVEAPHDADARQLNDLARLKASSKVIANNERWLSFRRWAPALGLAVPTRVTIGGKLTEALEPVPVEAINAELDAIGAGQHPIPETLRVLRAAMPYLPGGATAQQLEKQLGAPLDPDEQAGFLASSLAESLLLLEARGRISLAALADAEGVQLRDGDTTRPVTHITVLEVAA